ncbi:MAG: radical SAM protein [Candidatus Heimdallarchaeota archaeon]
MNEKSDKAARFGTRLKYEEIRAKSAILNKYSDPDSWFWVEATTNPYRGCQHNCAYCDGKAEYYQIEDFASHIRVKTNAPQLLTKELINLGFHETFRPGRKTLLDYLPDEAQEKRALEGLKGNKQRKFLIAVGGGVCDVYQPAEAEFRVTRALLKVCRDFGFPVSMLTKNVLILRDLDLLKAINEISYANVSFSITLADEKLRKIFEPGSSSSTDRFTALQKVRRAKLPGGVMFMPILPGIGDTDENMRAIIGRAKEVGAEFVLPAGLTLKPGRNKDAFLQVIATNFPEKLPLYKDIYRSNNKYGIGDFSKCINVAKEGHELCKEFDIPDRIPRYLGNARTFLGIPNNLRVSEILHEIAYLIQFVHGQGWNRAQAYKKAAEAIEDHVEDVNMLPIEELQNIPNVGTSIAKIVHEIIETGTCGLKEKLY